MDWLKRHWVEIVVIGSLQALVGLVATASMQAFLSSDAAKDAGRSRERSPTSTALNFP